MKCATSLLLLFIVWCRAQDYEFDDDFSFGVATAAYQIEGAWNESGKSESIWDYLLHTNPNFTADDSNGDIACNAYYNTEVDVQLLVDLGVDTYRLSLSWPRILPDGYNNNTNEEGVAYYNDLIDALVAKNITPLVTIFHWDLPQVLQDNHGGWLSSDLIDIYVDFVDVVFSLYGDRVKDWITFNEPHIFCEFGYGTGTFAPALQNPGVGGYACAHNILIAHGKTYELYNDNYRDTQEGQIGIVVDGKWMEPASDSEEDIAAAEQAMQFELGWIAHPIFSEDGDYPAIMRELVDANSVEEGYETSRLPSFTDEEIALIKGSADFLGLNHYTSNLCTAEVNTSTVSRPSYAADIGATCYLSDDWETTGAPQFRVAPFGMRSILNWIKDEYNNTEVVIAENGYSDRTGDTDDCRRIYYINSYLTQLLYAVKEDGCNVTGYNLWSFMDNFSWRNGYNFKYGLVNIDFDDDDRPRTRKMSSYIFNNIINTRAIDWDYTPDGFDACEW